VGARARRKAKTCGGSVRLFYVFAKPDALNQASVETVLVGRPVIAVVSGEAHLTYSSIPSILPHVRAGRVRALGVGNAQRIPSLPEFPTIAEAGLPGYEAYAWGGMIGPANMPPAIVQRLSREIIEVLKLKDVTDRMLAEGTVPTPSGPEEFTAYIKSELKKWGDVVKMANIKAE